MKPINDDFYVVPLEPANLSRGITVYDQNEARPSTADIIAQQSQDYVDEKLAEYQATISLLQGKEFPGFYFKNNILRYQQITSYEMNCVCIHANNEYISRVR